MHPVEEGLPADTYVRQPNPSVDFNIYDGVTYL